MKFLKQLHFTDKVKCIGQIYYKQRWVFLCGQFIEERDEGNL